MKNQWKKEKNNLFSEKFLSAGGIFRCFLFCCGLYQILCKCFFSSWCKSVSKSCRIFILSSSPMFRQAARTAMEKRICRRINMDIHHTWQTAVMPTSRAKSHIPYITYLPELSGVILICRIVSSFLLFFSHRMKRFPRKVLRPYLTGASFRFSPGQRRNTVFFSIPQYAFIPEKSLLEEESSAFRTFLNYSSVKGVLIQYSA